MKRITILLLVLLGGAAMFPSCVKNTTVIYSFSNQDFVTHAASSFNFQIAAGNLAKSKGVSDSVKSYGAIMVSDNTGNYTGLQTLASSKGLTVSTTLQASDHANLDSLSAQTGIAFDKAYAQMMIVTHNQEITMFGLALQYNGVADADLRAFAYNQVPQLNMQLQSAYSLQYVVASE